MAGWYHDRETRRGGARRLLAALRVAEPPPPADSPVVARGLREAHVRLVTAYCGAYPEDVAERMRCNDELREGPQRELEQAAG